MRFQPPSEVLVLPVVDGPPNAADALAFIEQNPDLPKAKRAQLATAIRKAVRICHPELDQKSRDQAALRHTARAVPMDCGYLNERLFRTRFKAQGLEDRSFNNLVSSLREVLRLLDRYPLALPLSTGLSPPWRTLHGLLSPERRKGLIAFFGYCDRRALQPADVAQHVLDDFVGWTRQETLHRDPEARGRKAASNWEWARQNIGGWPDIALVRPGMRDEYTIPLASYPRSFQDDVDAFLDRYACQTAEELFPDEVTTKGYRSFRSRRRPLSPRSVETRRYQIRQAAAALVVQGTPIESFTGLRDLVVPTERARSILLYHLGRAEERKLRGTPGGYLAGTKTRASDPLARRKLQGIRTSNLAGIGEMLRQVAHFHCAAGEKELDLLKEWISKVKPPQQTSMTEKNTLRLRSFLEPQTYGQMIRYPADLMRRASSPELKPEAAARLALYAVAFEILTVCPMRRGNLASLCLDRHLWRARPDGPFTHLHVPAGEVKNKQAIDWPLDPESGKLIQAYLQRHRHHLAEPGNPFLFPGRGQRGRSGHDLGVGLTERFERDIGAKFNTHAMRHLAVIRFLNRHPGQYEVVRRILGHTKVTTTIAFYSGPEVDRAVELFASVLRDGRREFQPPEISLSSGRHPRQRKA